MKRNLQVLIVDLVTVGEVVLVLEGQQHNHHHHREPAVAGGMREADRA
ncbi:hypothetical protein SDC9_171687 [bioreactor metagenome]|uniref:Uncharacterized protein n=1 Tax=bioreactor metagenome TaxID=1076179 RepID=A0A645GE55_9ZZZZ